MSTFQLRLPDHVMAEARSISEETGASLNQLFVSMIAEKIGEIKATAALNARAKRADVGKALAVLDRVPRGPVAEGDTVERG